MTPLINLGRLLLGTLMLTAVAINFANVVGRYVFASPIFWAEEAMVFLQIWTVLMGAALITHAGTHLRMDALYSVAPQKMRWTLDLLGTALMGGASAVVMVVSGSVVMGMIASDQRSVALEIPMAIPYAALPVGFGFITLLALQHMWQLMRRQDTRTD
jgi:TRAP-type C4-dicarboxylate transport system permease small subunit